MVRPVGATIRDFLFACVFGGELLYETMDAGDHELLRSFCQSNEEGAFRELVRRHLAMVHGVALRMLRDPALADDVAQNTFALLARKAASIRSHQTVAGWLHQTARHEALHVIRSEQRRRRREEVALTMQFEQETHDSAGILESLELALQELRPADREILVLRFLEERALADVGRELGVTEDTARMRVNRALDRMRGVFEKRGLAVTIGTLSAAMLSQARATVPVGLTDAVLSSALSHSTVAAGVAAGSAETLAWLNAKTVAAAIATLGVIGTAVYLIWHEPESPTAQSRGGTSVVAVSVEPLEQSGNASSASAASGVSGAAGGVESNGEEAPTAEARALVEQARAMVLETRYEDAHELLTRALELSPRYPDAYLVRGLALYGLGQVAMTAAAPAVEQERVRIGMRPADSAEASFSSALELRPTFVDAWLERARVYIRLERFELAAADCTRALNINSNSAAAWLRRGEARFRMGEFSSAMEDLNHALELNHRLADGYHYRALIHLARQELSDALVNRRRAVEVDPDNAEQHFRLGETLRQVEGNADALPALNRALELDPAYSEAYRERSSALAGLRRLEEAVADLTRHLKLQPSHYACFTQRGVSLMRLGQFERAINDFDEAIRLNAEHARAYACRGHALANLGQTEQALADFDRSLRLQPDYEYALLQSAAVHRRLGNEEEASRLFARADAISPRHVEPTKPVQDKVDAVDDSGEVEP